MPAMNKLDRLNEHLTRLGKTSPFYQDRLAGIDLQLNSLTDFQQLPFTSKDDLASNNDAFLAVDKAQIRDIVTTSGTLGDPVSCYLTDTDLDRLGVNEAGSYKIAGCTSIDTFQLLTTIDKRFMAGLAYFLGVQELGACIIRSGPGALELQWESILKYEPTVLIAVPSFVPRLIRHAQKKGIDPNSTSVKKIICIGEPIRKDDLTPNHLANAIIDQWNVKLFSSYASTELATAFTECEHGKGVHVQEDLIHVEVLNDAGDPVEDGILGEVVATPLGVEGVPLLRYRTGDMCRLHASPCPCGRPGPRLGPVIGRKQQMLKLKGTSIYPNAVTDLLERAPEVRSFILEAMSDEHGLDQLCITLVMNDGTDQAKFEEDMAEKLRVRPTFKIGTNEDINRRKFDENARKPKIFFDLRNS